jgi:hypothetical protein
LYEIYPSPKEIINRINVTSDSNPNNLDERWLAFVTKSKHGWLYPKSSLFKQASLELLGIALSSTLVNPQHSNYILN